MLKKIFFILVSIFSSNIVFAGNESGIPIHCEWLPGCDSPTDTWVVEKVGSNIIAEMIKYIAVLAVIALMISGIMYMFSNWEEEKTKKAKSWILWSLTAVVLSISSYYLITTIANLNINLK